MPAVWRFVLLLVVCAGLSEGAASAQDADQDGIADALEAELAARFVPTLRPFDVDSGCYREVYVDPETGDFVERWPLLIYRARYPTKNGIAHPDFIVITFQVLYNNDCGYPILTFGGHRGDNEPFMVFLRYSYPLGDWVYDSLSTTAHWEAECFRRESRPVNENIAHPNVFVGHRKNSNHVNTQYGGCYDPKINPFYDNDQINTNGYRDIPDPSRLFNVGEPDRPLIDDLGVVRHDWAGQRVWFDQGNNFFEAGSIREVMRSMSSDHWDILKRPIPFSGDWDSQPFPLLNYPCTYTLSESELERSADSASGTIALATNQTWCGYRVTSDSAWLTASVTNSLLLANWPIPGTIVIGSGNGTISYALEPNSDPTSRTGTLTIGAVTVTVTQEGLNCTPSVSPSSESLGDQAAIRAISVGVPSMCGWTATTPDSWITIVSGVNGTGNGTVVFSVPENNSLSQRTGTINIGPITVVVTQAHEACSPTVHPDAHAVAAASGGGTVNVVTVFNDCPWSAISSATWLTITAGHSGTGDGTVSYAFAANPGGTRTATIRVSEAVFTLTQAAAAPRVSFASLASTTSETAGTHIVTVRLDTPNALTGTLVVAYGTQNITATAGADYTAVSGTVTFAAGSEHGATRTIAIVIARDRLLENAETLQLTLSGPTGGILGSPATHTVTIANVQPPAVAGDFFDNDGKADLVLFRPGTGEWLMLESSTGFSSGPTFTFGLATDIPVPGDYNDDGRTDMAVYRPSTGMWYVIYSSTGLLAEFQWGMAGDVPVHGDYTGDGRTDLAIWRPSVGEWHTYDLATATTSSRQWGMSTDTPLIGDYDADGLTDVSVFRPTGAQWLVFHSSAPTSASYQWGIASDIPVPGDYDGDGRTDLAIYRPGNGTWWVYYTTTGTIGSYQWGMTGDIPAPKDYDGDGRTDLAVWRPSANTWSVFYTGTQQYQVITQGGTGGVPIR